MKKIIGYTDSVTECECCGKVDLKGTYCLEIDGVELYYGSVCAFKAHGITKEDQSIARAKFSKRVKAEAKLAQMEAENNGTQWAVTKIFRFAQSKGLDLMKIINKYGKLVSDEKFAKIYTVGALSLGIDKEDGKIYVYS